MRNIMGKYLELVEQVLSESINDKNIFKAVFCAGGPGCFSPDSKVKTKDGYKRISDIKIGDVVFTLDENNSIVTKEVEHLFQYDAPEDMIEIVLETNEKIVCTPDHEIRLIDGSWKKAKDLTDSDELFSL